jgi:hypothetical protein
MASSGKEQLLAEVEDVLRTMPSRATIRDPENAAWFGRALAAIERWNSGKGILIAAPYVKDVMDGNMLISGKALHGLTVLIHQAHHDLLAQVPGAGSIAVPRGMVFDYFDEVRKVIQLAKQDLFFVDPYLDADFVSRYLPHAGKGVVVRLLAREKLITLLPAVEAFSQQAGNKIEVRSSKDFHDRYVLIDNASCYQSGASFKDGAKSAPTTVTQIIDAFEAVSKTYEELWKLAKVER